MEKLLKSNSRSYRRNNEFFGKGSPESGHRFKPRTMQRNEAINPFLSHRFDGSGNPLGRSLRKVKIRKDA
jgi:hypothetical protein